MTAPNLESVHVNRRIRAAPERVFEAWTDPALLSQWLAPKAEADPHTGGRFRLEVSKPEGAHIVTGEYRELIPHQRLVMTWVYEGPMAPAEKMESLLTVTLRRDGAYTEIGLDHEGLSNAQYREVIRQGAWIKAFDAMEALLAV